MYKNYNKTNIQMSISTHTKKIEHLEKTFREYKKIESKSFHDTWLNLFNKAIYKSGGNPNFNEYDCISSCWKFFKVLGSNIKFDSIPKIIARLNYTSFRIRKLKNVKSGDIIIFKPIWAKGRQRWHMGIIEKVHRSGVFYMDVNAKVGTRDFKFISFYNKKIRGMYRMTFAYWVGDLHNKFKI